MRLAVLILPLLLAACVGGPRLNAGLSLGPGGVRVVPSVSAGLAGGGTISYPL